MRSGRISLADRAKAVVDLGLPNEKGWPHRGWVDFANNKVDPQTGTLSVRGVFPNPKPERGPRFLTPGQFVRHSLEKPTCDHVTCAAGDLFGTGHVDLVTGNFTVSPSPALTIWKNRGR